MELSKNKELAGLIKEATDESVSPISKEVEEMKAKAAEQEEANAKLFEDNTELKAKFDAMQDKVVTMATKTAGIQQYVFKGYKPELSKNFKSTLTTDQAEEVAKAIMDKINSGSTGAIFDKAYDASGIIPVEYGSAVMGLAELNSVALTHMNVMTADAPTIKLPAKATRETADFQTSGTANAEGTQTIGQITWTIDKRIGTYIDLRNDEIDDANFDIVNQVIIPMQAEAVGVQADDETFNKTAEFTSGIVDAPAGVTVSGTVAMAAAITFANLNTMFYSVEWERGILNPMWFGSRAALKDIAGLLDGNSRPIFQQVPINGRPSQTLMGSQYVITPALSDTPSNGAIRLAFGDPRHYTIFIRGGKFVSMVNPYVLMKEDKMQFICKARMDGNISDHATPGSTGAWTTMLRTDA